MQKLRRVKNRSKSAKGLPSLCMQTHKNEDNTIAREGGDELDRNTSQAKGIREKKDPSVPENKKIPRLV